MLTTQYAPVKQAGNGVVQSFNFNFKILALTDLKVSKIDALGVPSGTLVYGVDYTATFDPVAETGTVVYTVAPVTNGYSLIERDSDNTQTSSLQREGPLPAKTLETMVDKLTALIQEAQGAIALLQAAAGGAGVVTKPLADLQALAVAAPTVPFIGVALDEKTIYVYTGNVNLGTNGWWLIGGGS
jgi:hypothetical protein